MLNCYFSRSACKFCADDRERFSFDIWSSGPECSVEVFLEILHRSTVVTDSLSKFSKTQSFEMESITEKTGCETTRFEHGDDVVDGRSRASFEMSSIHEELVSRRSLHKHKVEIDTDEPRTRGTPLR